ncbi:hydroxymethylpyrimidine kinase / phosphomethylpyrimidine kinase / thiamine-phosphate diphosphorylase [Selenomonas ruminantium]|uniref:Thiamine-phosphate synthase n=1 Tax=Selenomonas ruminantium TaxID=971 RepID=A0A1H0RIZ4_SELRU|nr:hydroxymethylpyrimidine kinase / phosphomethylpyrimidine kinase / thiamine-phosphate diphosphorylase [Selenomonas ruminantium]
MKSANITAKDLRLYAVTDRRWLKGASLASAVEKALQGGVTCVQLREKDLPYAEFLATAKELKRICQQYHVPFIVDDNLDIALACEADGLHIGQKDMPAAKARELLGPDKILGVSAQTVEQATAAYKAGADYLGVGAVFPTGTKDDAVEVTTAMLKAITTAVPIPVVAIGGINAENIRQLKGTGIAGAAVVSAIFAQEDSQKAAAELRQLLSTSPSEGRLPAVLTIAGSDSSGGAGIQADLKTMLANGVYGMSAITALTAQNTTGVAAVAKTAPEILAAQLDSVFTDIFPDAVKTGMVFDSDLIAVIADKLTHYQAKNIVVDPVMVATSGARLLNENAISALQEKLLPLATLITPNLLEAEVLADRKIHSHEDMVQAAQKLYDRYGCNVLCKGGHRLQDADDLLYTAEGAHWLKAEHIDNPNTHGTGCTLSSAIASQLAKGETLPRAVEQAKAYITGALKANLNLGKGSGPLHHGWNL